MDTPVTGGWPPPRHLRVAHSLSTSRGAVALLDLSSASTWSRLAWEVGPSARAVGASSVERGDGRWDVFNLDLPFVDGRSPGWFGHFNVERPGFSVGHFMSRRFKQIGRQVGRTRSLGRSLLHRSQRSSPPNHTRPVCFFQP